MAAAPCKECGRRPKLSGRHRCQTCQLRHAPIGEQVAAAARRLAMMPEPMRLKRTKKTQAMAPAGTAWCAACQSFRDLEDFGKNATSCRACVSARSHASMVAKTYGLGLGDYDRMLEAQEGRCAICRARPKSKRLAVDHDHKTGAVRGLLCSRCNHDLMGSAWDSMAIASALWHYLNTPPASGAWVRPEDQPMLAAVEDATSPAKPSGGEVDSLVTNAGNGSARPQGKPGSKLAAQVPDCTVPHFLPAGAISVPGKKGLWKVWASGDPSSDAPF